MNLITQKKIYIFFLNLGQNLLQHVCILTLKTFDIYMGLQVLKEFILKDTPKCNAVIRFTTFHHQCNLG